MKEITFRTKKYHIAESPGELRKAMQASYQPGYEMHHIFGRTGILKLTVENILYVSAWVHGMQKSTNVDDRHTFDMFVRNAIGEERWNNLEELAKYIKNQNPLYRG